MSDFVTPKRHRLTMSGGQTIDIAARLSHGETEDMYARISPYGVGINRREVRTAKLLAYIIGWSLTGADGSPVQMSPDLDEQARLDTIRSLDPDLAVEIHTAIEAHETADAQARADLKKTRDGKSPDNPTSPLPSAAAGGSSGSEI